ncbi:MAG: helix-turn-helix transcriptional regulator [Candidatus Methylomirabilis oxyfera]|nr:helix-turn-helix transcriptional regulator [Candidatus Methylomirabilis oxyfera]
MERLTARDLRGLLAFLEGVYAVHDLDGLVEYVLRQLPKLVRSDLTAYNEINPRQRRIVWREGPPLAGVFPEGREIFQQHMADHPLIAHYERSRDGSARKISDFLTQRQFHRLGLYTEFFRRFDGGDYQMVITLPTPQPLVVGISVNRDHRDFTERDRLVLNLLRPHLIQAYRNAEAMTELAALLATLGEGVDSLGRGLIVVSREGRVRFATRSARHWMTGYFEGRSWSGERLPEMLRVWLKQQEACLASTGDAPRARTPFVVARDDRRLLIRLVSEPDRLLLLLEEELTTVVPRLLEPHGFTRRESEVLAWVAEGKTNAEIGQILSMRRRTVSKHLERVFQKLGVETRTAAALQALALLRQCD